MEEHGANGVGGGKKSAVTFSFKRKPGSAVKVVEKVKEDKPQEGVEILTAYDEEVASRKTLPAPKVIPKQENTWRPEKRLKNLVVEAEITAEATHARFEAETLPSGPQPDVQYGLTVRDGGVAAAGQQEEARAVSRGDPEGEALRKDLQELPDESSLEAYERMPIEDFGEALLRGMGWEKGKPIGRRCKEVVEPVQYSRREQRLGLGAKPVPVEIAKKPGDRRGTHRDMGPPASVERGDSRGVGRASQNGSSERAAGRGSSQRAADRGSSQRNSDSRESRGRRWSHEAASVDGRGRRSDYSPARDSESQDLGGESGLENGQRTRDIDRRGSDSYYDQPAQSRRGDSYEDERIRRHRDREPEESRSSSYDVPRERNSRSRQSDRSSHSKRRRD